MATSLRAGPVSAPVIPLMLMGTGAYLAWYGVHYWARGGWPTDPVKSVLQGKGIPDPGQSTMLSNAQLTADISTATATAEQGPGPGTPQSGQGTLNYTRGGLITLWTSNGGDPTTAGFAADVALSESSGEAGVTSANPDGGTNVGLWQLDTKGVGAGYTVAQLKNPDTNCRITVMATRNGHDWRQWSDPVVNSLPGRMFA